MTTPITFIQESLPPGSNLQGITRLGVVVGGGGGGPVYKPGTILFFHLLGVGQRGDSQGIIR